MKDRQQADTAVHLRPVWRDRANFIIVAPVTDFQGRRWEQLWARQIGNDQFEICCIPFFVYDLSLGDIVQTETRDGEPYVVARVLVDAERYVFRIWFGRLADLAFQHTMMDEVEHKLSELDCEIEWHSHDLLGVSANKNRAQAVADYLQDLESRCDIEFEAGRTH